MSLSSSADPFAVMNGHQYMLITTYRKSGQPVPTPVWFVQAEGKIYLYTGAKAGKVKRIRYNPKVQIAPCTGSGSPLGPAVEAAARILPPEEAQTAIRLLNRKYGLLKAGLDLIARLNGALDKRVYIELIPADRNDSR